MSALIRLHDRRARSTVFDPVSSTDRLELRVQHARDVELEDETRLSYESIPVNLPRWLQRVAASETYPEFSRVSLTSLSSQEFAQLEANLKAVVTPQGKTVEDIIRGLQAGQVEAAIAYLRQVGATRQFLPRENPRQAFNPPRQPLETYVPRPVISGVTHETYVPRADPADEKLAELELKQPERPPPGYPQKNLLVVLERNRTLPMLRPTEKSPFPNSVRLIGQMDGNLTKSRFKSGAIPAWRKAMTDRQLLQTKLKTTAENLDADFHRWLLDRFYFYIQRTSSQARYDQRNYGSRPEDKINGWGLKPPGKTIKSAYERFRMC